MEHSFGSSAQLVASIYSSTIRDLIVLDADASGELLFRNQSQADSIGADLALELRRRHGIAGHLGYSFQRTRSGSGETVTNSPAHMLKADLGMPLADERVWIAADAQFMTSRRTLAGQRAGRFLLANLTVLAHRLPWGLELAGGIYNVLDARYADPASTEHTQDVIAQDGRSCQLKLDWRF